MDSKRRHVENYLTTSPSCKTNPPKSDGKVPRSETLRMNSNIDISNEKKTSTNEQKDDAPKWYNPLENGEAENEDLLCVVRQFCLEKPVTMAAMTYCHVKLC